MARCWTCKRCMEKECISPRICTVIVTDTNYPPGCLYPSLGNVPQKFVEEQQQ